jgi:glycosyltransferase involved in cell wall biosynthesis
MHRSGTSALTRVLNLHGVDLGTDLLDPAEGNNAKGFWEKRAVVDLHERLLADLGRSWHDPRPLPLDWLKSEAAIQASEEIGGILQEFSHSPLFAIKDPRLCQFIGLWLPVLSRLDVDVKVVFSVRHPANVAESLLHRDGWPFELSWLLWARSVFDTYESTTNSPRAVVNFQHLLQDSRATMLELERRLQLRWPVPPEKAEKAVARFLDTGAIEKINVKTLSKRKAPRYLLSVNRALANIEKGGEWSQLEELAREHSEFDHSSVPLHEGGELRRGDPRRLSQMLDEKDLHIAKLCNQIDALIVDRDARTAGLELRNVAFDELSKRHAEDIENLSAVIADKHGHSLLLEGMLKELNEQGSSQKALVTELEHRLEAANATIEESAATSSKQKALMTELGHRLEAANATLEVSASAASRQRELIDDYVLRIGKLEDEVRAGKAERDGIVNAMSEELRGLEAKRLSISSKNQELRTLLRAKYVKNQELQQSLDTAHLKIEELQSSLIAGHTKNQELQQSLDAAHQGNEKLRGSLDVKFAENQDLQQSLAAAHLKNEELQRSLDSVYQRRSWRMTAPLRRLRRFLSRTARHFRRDASHAASKRQDRFASKILLVSYYCPTRAHAGGLRILDIYAYLKAANPGMRLDLYTHHRPHIDWSLDDCRKIFDNIYLAPGDALTPDGLAALGCPEKSYDVIDLQFHQSAQQADAFRELGGKLIFTPMESALRVFLIGLRSLFANMGRSALRAQRDALRTAVEEIVYCRKVDEVVCVSERDARYLRVTSWPTKVIGLETGLSSIEFGDAIDRDHSATAAGDRLRVLYLAYFGSQTNVDALRWYLDNVHPIVKSKVPGYLLSVVGRGDLSPFKAYADDSIEFVGEVPRIGPQIERATIGVAPALGGSGLRGKVNQYALFGVPCVVSPISLKGLAYTDGIDILVAESARDYAAACVRLLLDPTLRRRMGQAARDLCLRRYTWESKDGQLAEAYRTRRNMVQGAPKVTVLVPSYNHAGYLKQRIESIFGQTYRNMELVVIDDKSPDNSDEVIFELRKSHDFRYIRNKENSGTPFAAWGRIAEIADGDYIWICESDDFAEPTFLETAVHALLADQSAVVFYCNSWVVDESGRRVGDTGEYFSGTWRDPRWEQAFDADGRSELVNYQQRGQVVPNMSSALIDADAFRKSYRPLLKRFKLTGDWLFIGWLMEHGRVLFDPAKLSNFRKHEVTSRVRVQSARSQAEFVLTKFLLFRSSRRPLRDLPDVLASDAIRFAYEPARWYQVVLAMLRVSWTTMLKCSLALGASIVLNPKLIQKVRGRLAHARDLNQ